MDRTRNTATGAGPTGEGPSILVRVAAGEALAVGELHDRYGALVWSTVRRGAGRWADEDLVQEIFIDLWRSAGHFDPARGNESAFVRTVARRRVIDRSRRSGRTTPVSRTTGTPLLEELAAEDQGLDTLETHEEARRVMEALAQLPPEKRSVLQLVLVSGLSHSAVAEATDLPLGTVKSHARRGLRHLRAILGVAEEEGRESS